MSSSIQILLIQFMVISPFIFSGVSKALNFSGAVEEFTALDIPLTRVAVFMTIIVQLAASIMIIAGWYKSFGVFSLIGFTIVATLIGHQIRGKTGPEFTLSLTISFEHLAIVGGLFALLFI